MKRVALLAAGLLLAACAPDMNWREVPSADGRWSAMLPAKPLQQTRRVSLNGMQLEMEMQAAEVDHVTYAAGGMRVLLPSMAAPTLVALKTALLKNVNATMHSEKTSAGPDGSIIVDIDAVGTPVEGSGPGRPRAVATRLISRGDQLVQGIVVGPQDRVTQEAVQTFQAGLKIR